MSLVRKHNDRSSIKLCSAAVTQIVLIFEILRNNLQLATLYNKFFGVQPTGIHGK